MQRASRVLVRGLELRPTAARLVARGGAVVGILAPSNPRAAPGWRWWTPAAGGGTVPLAVCARTRRRSHYSPDGEDTTREAGATQINTPNKGDLGSQGPVESVSPPLDAGTGEAPRRLVAPHTHHVARVLLRTART